jgi:hypothetical protein
MFYTSIIPGASGYFQKGFSGFIQTFMFGSDPDHSLLEGWSIHPYEDRSLFPCDLGAGRLDANAHPDVFSAHVSHGRHSNPFHHLCAKR